MFLGGLSNTKRKPIKGLSHSSERRNARRHSNKHRLMIITFSLGIGGLERVVVNLCKNINREKFDVSVLCLRIPGEFVSTIESMGIKVLFISKEKDSTDYLSFLKVAKILRQEKIEIIHTHNTQPFIDGTIGALLSGVKTIVHTDHARDFPDKRRYMFLEWFLSHFAYKIVGVSEHTSQNLIKFEKISHKKVITIYNGIDGAPYETIVDKMQIKRSLGVARKGPIIGLGVRLTKQKGITYLLQAMPKVIKEIPEVTLIIAGDGPLESELKRKSVSLGIENNTLFVGPRLDIPELLQIFALYVLPSVWEGLPMVILETMAAKCPIVATDVGGNSSAITHGFNGSLVKSKDPEALAEEILRLLSDQNVLKRYRKNALVTFKKKFSSEIMTKKYEKLYLREL